MDSDSDDDTYVTIGTPLETYDEDEPTKKPVRAHETAVVDSRGRQRFHGAFTGGFSAGYFNSVGTKEGWTPSTFVSARVDREASSSTHQLPEHFMDNEDFGEHGIAPRSIVTTDEFHEAGRKPAAGSGNVIPGTAPLQDLVLPARLPIAVKLLRKMGWKEGQGVGPRVKKKRKRRWGAPQANGPGVKVYGCAMPTAAQSESEESDGEFAVGLTFAPKDIPPVSFVPKDNLHGLGYSGIDAQSALTGHVNLFEAPVVSSTGRKGIRGQAFGVGAFEDEDSDIYAVDHLSNYDRQLGGVDTNRTHGWTAPKGVATDSKNPTKGIEEALAGFRIASAPSRPKVIYPPPTLPRGYQPFHRFDDVGGGSAPSTSTTTSVPAGRQLNASARGAMLKDPSQIKSVFDIISSEDSCRLRLTQQQLKQRPATVKSEPVAAEPPSADQPSADKPSADKQSADEPVAPSAVAITPSLPSPAAVTSAAVPSTLAAEGAAPPLRGHGGSGFKPFENDPAKQERYEAYLALCQQGAEASYSPCGPQLTEWERRRERADFGRASQLYRPLSGVMASRFTTSGGPTLPDVKEEQSSEEKAAAMKQYGRLTRSTAEWRPDKLLCKRFNVPNPYPDSETAAATTKKEEFSLFNFLGQPAMKTDSEDRNDDGRPSAKTEDRAVIGHSADTITRGDDTISPCDDGASRSEEGGRQPAIKTDPIKLEPVGEVKRPPIDLFKAIFADSESSGSESDEDDVMEVGDDDAKESSSSVIVKQEPVPEGVMNTSSASVVKSEVDVGPAEPIQDGRSDLCNVKVESVDPDVYGPKLPDSSAHTAPASLPSTAPGQNSVPERKASKHRKHSKHRHKEKSDKKEHKKKSKDDRETRKKEKSQHKRKRSRRRRSSLSLSSESDDGVNSRHDDVDALLLQRLKGMKETTGR